MRRTAFALLILAGCSESPNMTEFNNLSAQTIADRARIAELTRQLGRPVADPMVASLVDQIAALKAENVALAAKVDAIGKPAKVPHLVSRDTGVDYGISIDGALAAWDPRFEAVIDYSKAMDTSFTLADCKGDPLINRAAGIITKFPRYLFDPSGRLLRATAIEFVNAPNGSTLDTSGVCTNYQSVAGIPAAFARFSTPYVSPDNLDIALR